MINMIGYLRGQHNAFLSFRPMVKNQSEMYAVEQDFENKLHLLIQKLHELGYYPMIRDDLQRYYVEMRAPWPSGTSE